MRMVLVFTPYRNNLPYSKDVFAQYEKTYDKWQRAYKQGLYELQLNDVKDLALDEDDILMFKNHMDQDLNVQNVMTLVEQIVKDLNMAIRSKNIDVVGKKWTTLDTILKVMGINMFVQKMNDEQLGVYKDWINARNQKDFNAADIARAKLIEWKIV